MSVLPDVRVLVLSGVAVSLIGCSGEREDASFGEEAPQASARESSGQTRPIDSRTPASLSRPDTQWHTIECDAGFSFQMPGLPEQTDVDRDAAGGLTRIRYEFATEDVAYLVGYVYSEEPIDETKALAAAAMARDGMLAGSQGTLVYEKPFGPHENRGWEMLVEIGPYYDRQCVYYGVHALYMAKVVTAAPRADTPEIRRFLNSFEVSEWQDAESGQQLP